MRLKDRVAIVTGAGSGTGPNQGIGKAFCRRFLEEGAKVAIAEINESRGKEVVNDLSGLGDIEFVQTDVTDRTSAEGLAADVMERFGRIDILVNNAGIYGDMMTLRTQLADDPDPTWTYLRRVMDVNMFGVWVVSAAVVPRMSSQRSGRIVNIASDAAFMYSGMGMPDDSNDLPDFAYGWSKWNVVGLTRFMAGALGPRGITVNCIAPGITLSDATRKGMGYGADEGMIEAMTQAMTALKKPLDPADIANAALLLVSDEGSLITGQTLSVDAGLVIGHS